jgi:hypothetical protein
MKKLVLSIALVAFGVAVQAGDTQSCQDKAACCSKSCSTQQTKAGNCPNAAAKTAKAAKPLLSPKAAAEVASR